jgi:uncharacterized protein (TIGR00369 family)
MVRLQKNGCFVCGQKNDAGLKLRFRYDKVRDCYICRFRLDERYMGPPNYVHGGIVATVLDEVMGKVNKSRGVVALTRVLKIDYLKPVPLNQFLHAEGHPVSAEGRKHTNRGEILNAKGEVLARGEGLFIAIDVERMFGKDAGRK